MVTIGILTTIAAIALPFSSVLIPPPLLSRIGTLSLLSTAALAAHTFSIQPIGSEVALALYGGLLTVQPATELIDTLLPLAGGAILTFWAPSTSLEGRPDLAPTGRYALIALFSLLGSSLLLSATDLVSMYLALELQSFGLYLLATLYKDRPSATAAGLKYFLLGALSSSIILLGCASFYNRTGSTQIGEIAALLASSSTTTGLRQATFWGIPLLLAGCLFKIAAAPLHHWAPDVYHGSPTIVTAWLTTLPKLAILALLSAWWAPLVQIGTETDGWKTLLLVGALLSLGFGTVVGLVQSKIKRLLAYSTVSHVGFLLIALVFSSPSERAKEALLFYLIQYTATNVALFAILLALGYRKVVTSDTGPNPNPSQELLEICELRGLFKTQPVLSGCLALCLFSMVGIPPLIGFFAKQMVLTAALQQGYLTVAAIGVVTSVVGAYYYLRLVRTLFQTPISSAHTASPGEQTGSVSGGHAIVIATVTLALSFFLLYPSFLFNSVSLASLS